MRRARPNVHPRWSRSTNASKRGPGLFGHPRWSRSTNSCASERKDTKGADPKPSMGQKLQTLGRAALPSLCLCLPGFCAPWLPFPLSLSSGVCSCGCLLRCLAVLPLSLYLPACVVPSISSRLTGTVPRTGKIFGQSTSVLYLASQKFSERWRKKEVSIYNENPVACWIKKRSFSSMLASTLEQTGKGQR